jgi:hypothetical protein
VAGGVVAGSVAGGVVVLLLLVFVVFFGGSLPEVCALSPELGSSVPSPGRVSGVGAEQPVSAVRPTVESARRETATSWMTGFMVEVLCVVRVAA